MTDISKLRVSLTKHGAHKISRLIKRFPVQKILENVSGQVEGINIDRTQTAVIMSEQSDGGIPQFWADAKLLGGDVVDAIVMLAIIFSHYRLIAALQAGGDGFAHGVITRQLIGDDKVYSNIKNDLIELGFARGDSAQLVEYDFSRIFSDNRIARLALLLFAEKLKAAGWKGTQLVDECVEQGFHSALAVTEDQFRDWASGVTIEIFESTGNALNEEDDDAISDFIFKHGHAPRKESGLGGPPVKRISKIDLIHNRLQTLLHEQLKKRFGEESVGTEIPSGVGKTFIDAVHRADGKFTFYELKTTQSIRRCIREALPQLLEYAFWPAHDRATQLIIVAPAKPNDDAKGYIKMLRNRFGVPIYYQRIDEKTGELMEKV